MTSQFNRRLIRHAALLSLIAAASMAAPGGAIMALTPAAGPSLEGRWVEAAAGKEKQGFERIGTLDIMACGDAMCGVIVSPSGQCGAVIGHFGPPQLRPTKVADTFDALFRGTLQWRGRKTVATLSLTGAGLHVTAGPGAWEASLSRSVMPSYNAGFVRAGAANCSAPVS